MEITRKYVSSIIDHTLLKPDATLAQIDKLCAEAAEHGFASVCVNPDYVARCARQLKGSGVNVCTVIGFPLGATTAAVKAFETEDAIRNGANEVDMVANIGRIKNGDWAGVAQDIEAVVRASAGRARVKVIIETCLLTDVEKLEVCRLAEEAGADFVKTSTGFSTGGATVEDVALMRSAVGPKVGVKASGGIRDASSAVAMIRAGATRLGVSAGIAIVNGLPDENRES